MRLAKSSDSNGTSKLCFMLSQQNFDELRTITPAKLEAVFGISDIDYFDWERGYEDPEWYFEAECGAIVGIGFRWRVPRFRGKNVSPKTANQFISYLSFRLRGRE